MFVNLIGEIMHTKSPHAQKIINVIPDAEIAFAQLLPELAATNRGVGAIATS